MTRTHVRDLVLLQDDRILIFGERAFMLHIRRKNELMKFAPVTLHNPELGVRPLCARGPKFKNNAVVRQPCYCAVAAFGCFESVLRDWMNYDDLLR